MNNEKVNTDIEVKLYTENHSEVYFLFKRFMDIMIAIISLIILVFPFIILAIIIKFDDPHGPILFKQERVGVDGKKFKMFKFRSMYNDAEHRLDELMHLNEIEGHMFKMKKDPRITRIGSFLRAYSIDEVPQLLNVLMGDMSLIGPRPPLVSEYSNYSNYDKKRLLIKPGITGLWQVSGRNALSFKEMVALDIEYIHTLCLKNDVSIFLKTIIVVAKKENAY